MNSLDCQEKRGEKGKGSSVEIQVRYPRGGVTCTDMAVLSRRRGGEGRKKKVG